MARGPRDSDASRNEPPDVIELRRTLARHGFVAAATALRPFDRTVGIGNIALTIRAWDNYPRSMEMYPKRLRKRSY